VPIDQTRKFKLHWQTLAVLIGVSALLVIQQLLLDDYYWELQHLGLNVLYGVAILMMIAWICETKIRREQRLCQFNLSGLVVACVLAGAILGLNFFPKGPIYDDAGFVCYAYGFPRTVVFQTYSNGLSQLSWTPTELWINVFVLIAVGFFSAFTVSMMTTKSVKQKLQSTMPGVTAEEAVKHKIERENAEN
jgi:hypothetical protein